MTECERIIQQGILPKSFFEEEVRCDFKVDLNRKKIWAIELDLLLKFDSVCRKYNLTYYLFWGSLLGAVRHKGFVPWDDDTDVVMPRQDYEKMLTLRDEFSDQYFLQTPYTDKGFFYAHAKLRNSNTTAWDRPFAYQGTNFGIFLDILPLDKVVSDDYESIFSRINKLILDNSTYMKLSNPNPAEKDLERIKNYDGKDPYDRYEEITSLSKKHMGANTEKVSVLACTTYGYERDCFTSSDFGEPVYVSFEGLKMPIPSKYEEVLKISYGDWKKMPPLDKRGGWHGNLLFEPDVPYKEYIKSCNGKFPYIK